MPESNNKHLMTGPKGNGNFYFSEEGKQNSLFPAVPIVKCFVIPLNSKLKKQKTPKKLFA